MSKRHLLVSNALSAINDPDNSRFVILGEVLHEQYMRIESGDGLPAFGSWEIEVDCGLGKVQHHCSVEHNQVFRIASNTENISREGEWVSFSPPDIPNDEDRPIWLGIDTRADDPVRHIHAMGTA